MINQILEYLHGRWSIVTSALIAMIVTVSLLSNPPWRQSIGSFIATYGPPTIHKLTEVHHRAEMARLTVELLAKGAEITAKALKHVHVRP